MYHLLLVISFLVLSGSFSTREITVTTHNTHDETITEFQNQEASIGSSWKPKTGNTTQTPNVTVPFCSTTQLVAKTVSVDYAWTLTGILSYVHLLGPMLSRNEAKLFLNMTQLKFKNVEFSGTWSASFIRCPRYGDVKIELTYTTQDKPDYYITEAEILVTDASGRRHQRSADIVTRQYSDSDEPSSSSSAEQEGDHVVGTKDVTKMSWDFHSSYLNEHVSQYKRRSKRGATGKPVLDQLDLVFNIGVVQDVPVRSQSSSHCKQQNIESELMKMEKK